MARQPGALACGTPAGTWEVVGGTGRTGTRREAAVGQGVRPPACHHGGPRPAGKSHRSPSERLLVTEAPGRPTARGHTPPLRLGGERPGSRWSCARDRLLGSVAPLAPGRHRAPPRPGGQDERAWGARRVIGGSPLSNPGLAGGPDVPCSSCPRGGSRRAVHPSRYHSERLWGIGARSVTGGCPPSCPMWRLVPTRPWSPTPSGLSLPPSKLPPGSARAQASAAWGHSYPPQPTREHRRGFGHRSRLGTQRVPVCRRPYQPSRGQGVRTWGGALEGRDGPAGIRVCECVAGCPLPSLRGWSPHQPVPSQTRAPPLRRTLRTRSVVVRWGDLAPYPAAPGRRCHGPVPRHRRSPPRARGLWPEWSPWAARGGGECLPRGKDRGGGPPDGPFQVWEEIPEPAGVRGGADPGQGPAETASFPGRAGPGPAAPRWVPVPWSVRSVTREEVSSPRWAHQDAGASRPLARGPGPRPRVQHPEEEPHQVVGRCREQRVYMREPVGILRTRRRCVVLPDTVP